MIKEEEFKMIDPSDEEFKEALVIAQGALDFIDKKIKSDPVGFSALIILEEILRDETRSELFFPGWDVERLRKSIRKDLVRHDKER